MGQVETRIVDRARILLYESALPMPMPIAKPSCSTLEGAWEDQRSAHRSELSSPLQEPERTIAEATA
jgi:hypothetical protein